MDATYDLSANDNPAVLLLMSLMQPASVLVRGLYFSGYVFLHLLHTEHRNLTRKMWVHNHGDTLAIYIWD